jgi:hypothetical protein
MFFGFINRKKFPKDEKEEFLLNEIEKAKLFVKSKQEQNLSVIF